MIIETLFGGEPSMDNPPIVTMPNVNIGDTFTFRGDYCTIKRMAKNKRGFWYEIQATGKEAYMSFSFYAKTPSQKAKKGIMVGLERKMDMKQRIITLLNKLL